MSTIADMNKTIELKKIAHEIESCRICKQNKSGKAVAGEGNTDANIVFLGEAPGREEAKTGRPFVGRSGKLLRLLIRDMGLKEEDVYITSPVKYLPDRGTPTREDIVHGRIHLFKQLDIIAPKLIVLLGKTAAKAMLDQDIPIMKEHGKIIIHKGRRYFLTLHPAAAVRLQKFRPLLEADFNVLKRLV